MALDHEGCDQMIFLFIFVVGEIQQFPGYYLVHVSESAADVLFGTSLHLWNWLVHDVALGAEEGRSRGSFEVGSKHELFL